MTTRAGLVGIITGLLTTLSIYPLFTAWHTAIQQGTFSDSATYLWIALGLAMLLMICGGMFAARWSGSAETARLAALGGLAGGLAGIFVFCLWGAGAAGTVIWVSPLAANTTQMELISILIRQTMLIFVALFSGGSILGALGGLLAGLRLQKHTDLFNKEEPQMAMNASITAVCASIVAAVIAAVVFPSLATLLAVQSYEMILDKAVFYLPLEVSLLLVLVSQTALTLNVPHETRQAEHRCGLNEVKMAAYVGIGTAPLLILLLVLFRSDLLSYPLISIALMLSVALSVISFTFLVKLVLPRRASFSVPVNDRQKTEANLFGSIAKSRGSRLVILCIGCGIMMILPIHVSVLSILINLTRVSIDTPSIQQLALNAPRLFLQHAWISMGIMIVTCTILSLMYIFYFNLGRWYSSWNRKHSN